MFKNVKCRDVSRDILFEIKDSPCIVIGTLYYTYLIFKHNNHNKKVLFNFIRLTP